MVSFWGGAAVTRVAPPRWSGRSEGGLVVAGSLAPATLLATLRLRGLLGRLLATPPALAALLGGRRGATGGPRVGLLASLPPPKPPPEPPRSALVTFADA